MLCCVMLCYVVYFSGKNFLLLCAVMSASCDISVRRISRRLRVAWIAPSFPFLKGIFLGWFVRGKKKKNNKDKNYKKFFVSFLQCQGFGGRRMCEEAMGSSSSLKWRWLNLSGSRVRRRRRRWEEETRNGSCFRWVDRCRRLWVAGTVEGHRQTDRQTDRQRQRQRRICVHVKGELVRREGPSNWLMQFWESRNGSGCRANHRGQSYIPAAPVLSFR